MQVVDKATSNIKNIDRSTQSIDKNLQNVNRRMNTFDMRLLSVMFGGMALNRLFSGINRAIFDTFKKADDSSSGLTQATTRLGAAWEFLKFSIVDALNTEFFIAAIDNVIKFIDWVSDLIDRFPILGQAMILAFGALAVGGAILMTIAQFKLFWDATFGIGGFLATRVAATTTAVNGLNTSLITLKGTAAGLTFSGLIAGLGAVATAAFAAWAAMRIGQGLVDQFSEDEGAPSVEDVAMGTVENIDVLNSGISETTQEFSNMRAGMDSTIQIMNQLDSSTGKITSKIVTQDDVIKGITASGQSWIEEQSNQIQLTPDLQNSINTISSSIRDQAAAYRELAAAKREANESFAVDLDVLAEASPVSD